MEIKNSLSARSLQYHVIACKWRSDLEFYKIEIAFFHRLIENHFINPSTAENLNDFLAIGKQLANMEIEVGIANKLLSEQSGQIELMAEDVVPEDPETLVAAQIKLEYLINCITGSFRKIKSTLFLLVDRLVKEKDLIQA